MPERPPVDEPPRWVAGKVGLLVAAAGGLLSLAAFLVFPALEGTHGPRAVPHVIALSDRLWVLGLLSLLPVAALIVAVLGVWRVPAATRRTRAASMAVVAGLAAFGELAALKVAQHPVGAAAAYAAGIDPASTLGPAYWLSLTGLVLALGCTVPDLLPQRGGPAPPSRRHQVAAGVAAGVALGLAVASTVLAERQDAIRHEVSMLATTTLGVDPFGPDFVLAQTAGEQALAGVGPGEVAGDSERLYGGALGRPGCDRDRLATFAAEASPARRNTWSRIVTDDPSADVRQAVAGLTPVRLRADARVTAHRFIGDRHLPYQATLQAGTSVLVDGHGVPRVRCAGAIPLGPPRTPAGRSSYRGPWPGFDPAALVTVTPSPGNVRQFGLDAGGRRVRRPAGSTGDRDLEQITGQAILNGSYPLTGTRSSCNLGDCDELTTRELTVTVTGCPDRCQVTGPDWSSGVELVNSGGVWRATGTATAGFACGDEPVPTSFTLTLAATAGQVVDTMWTATEIEGVFAKNSPSVSGCNHGELSWNVVGSRT